MFCLFTHPFDSECAFSLKKIPCLPIIANAKTVHKNLSIWQNWFLSTLEQFAVCRADNQDHALLGKKCNKGAYRWRGSCFCLNCHSVFCNSPLCVDFFSFILPRLMLLPLFFETHLFIVTQDGTKTHLCNLHFFTNCTLHIHVTFCFCKIFIATPLWLLKMASYKRSYDTGRSFDPVFMKFT